MRTIGAVQNRALRLTVLCLAALLSLLIPVQLALHGGDTGTVMAVAGGTISAALLLLRWWLHHRELEARGIAIATTVIGMTLAAEALLLTALTNSLQYTNSLLLVMVGTAVLSPRFWPLWVVSATSLVGWTAVVLHQDTPTRVAVVQESLTLVIGVAVAAAVHLMRSAAGLAIDKARNRAGLQRADLERTEASRVESERRFREVFTASPVGIALADDHGLFIEVNTAWCDLLGRRPDELLGRSSREFTHPDDLAQHASMARRMDDAAPAGGIVRVEKRYVRPSGEIRWGWLSVAAVHGPDSEQWTLAHVQDVTERKQAEAALRRSEAALAAGARVARCVQSGEDPRPTVLDAVMELTGAAAVRLIEEGDLGALETTLALGLDTADSSATLPTSMAESVWRDGLGVLIDDPAMDHPAEVVVADARAMLWQPVMEQGRVIAVITVSWTTSLIGPEDPAVQTVQMLAEESASAFTAARLRTELEALVDTDPLTGVANRRGWHGQVRDVVNTVKRNGQPLTLAVVDLDHFKAFNDSFGHHEGDALLREFAQLTQRALRSIDVVARWGGEEFAIALPGCSAHDAGPILDRLRALVPRGQTCSIGFATLLPGESPSDCLIRADGSLYDAKRSGRNRVMGAHP